MSTPPAEAMNPYLSDADFTLYNGEAREVLRELPAESVHMCVTSPPFFGLRDYGTGTWEGGDAECDHVARANRNDRPRNGLTGGTATVEAATIYRETCGKCGARRVDNQIGLEATPEEWVASLVSVFEEVRRVLRKDGTLWVECGDSYASAPRGNAAGDLSTSSLTNPERQDALERGSFYKSRLPGLKQKDLIGQPFLLAFALREAGWYWRNVCIWHKPNPMPESVRDRFTVSHSYVLLFSKSPRYFFDAEAVREPEKPWNNGKASRSARSGNLDNSYNAPQVAVQYDTIKGANGRTIWTIPTEPLPFEHYAAFPQALAERCIKAGTSERGCCPECGAPWLREVERGELVGTDRGGNYAGREIDAGVKRNPGTPGLAYENTTTGWVPSCDCGQEWPDYNTTRHLPYEPIPCTVLDPFLGSGTTALVARRLGRRCIGIELSAAYAELAARRTHQLALPFGEDTSPDERAEVSG